MRSRLLSTRCSHPAAAARAQWVMINRILRIMWPQITEIAMGIAIPQIKDNVQKALGKVGARRRCAAPAGACRPLQGGP
jgi:hypothetical protein